VLQLRFAGFPLSLMACLRHARPNLWPLDGLPDRPLQRVLSSYTCRRRRSLRGCAGRSPGSAWRESRTSRVGPDHDEPWGQPCHEADSTLSDYAPSRLPLRRLPHAQRELPPETASSTFLPIWLRPGATHRECSGGRREQCADSPYHPHSEDRLAGRFQHNG
jgi:hypothetical protein